MGKNNSEKLFRDKLSLSYTVRKWGNKYDTLELPRSKVRNCDERNI